jgi:hypothetical protein
VALLMKTDERFVIFSFFFFFFFFTLRLGITRYYCISLCLLGIRMERVLEAYVGPFSPAENSSNKKVSINLTQMHDTIGKE